jgi:hypothetical protein
MPDGSFAIAERRPMMFRSIPDTSMITQLHSKEGQVLAM